MTRRTTSIGGVIYSMSLVATLVCSIFAFLLIQSVAAITSPGTNPIPARLQAAPIATSGDNSVYIAWWTNKTGNDEVMFKASTDAGKTFGEKMNLSNSPTSDSQDVQISASGNNVYVSWWERSATSNEPVLRVSNDNGKTFGQLIMLSEK
jgi:hypothetical protein